MEAQSPQLGIGSPIFVTGGQTRLHYSAVLSLSSVQTELDFLLGVVECVFWVRHMEA